MFCLSILGLFWFCQTEDSRKSAAVLANLPHPHLCFPAEAEAGVEGTFLQMRHRIVLLARVLGHLNRNTFWKRFFPLSPCLTLSCKMSKNKYLLLLSDWAEKHIFICFFLLSEKRETTFYLYLFAWPDYIFSLAKEIRSIISVALYFFILNNLIMRFFFGNPNLVV